MTKSRAFVIVLAALFATVIGSALWLQRGRGSARGTGATRTTESSAVIEAPRAATERRPVAGDDPAGERLRLEVVVVSDRGEALVDADLVLFSGPQLDPELASEVAQGRTGQEGALALEVPESASDLFVLASAADHRAAVAPVVRGQPCRLVLERRVASLAVLGRVVDAQKRLLPLFEMQELVRVQDARAIGVRAFWRRVTQTDRGFALDLDLLGRNEVRLHLRAPGFSDHLEVLTPQGRDALDVGEIVLHRGIACWGVVVDGAGRPLGDVAVEPKVSGAPAPQRVRSDRADGTFEFSIPAEGSLRSIYFAGQDLAPVWVHERKVDGVWQGMQVVMGTGARLTGQVRAAGVALEGIEVCAWISSPEGPEPAAGTFGMTPWVRRVRSNADGIFLFERVPRGLLSVGLQRGPSERALSMIRTLEIDDAPLYTVQFDLQGSTSVVGRLKLIDEVPAEESLFLELRSSSPGEADRVLASAIVSGGTYRFEELPDELAGTTATVRIYVAPLNYIERAAHIAKGVNDLGTLDLSSPRALLEFNHPGGEFFAFGPVDDE